MSNDNTQPISKESDLPLPKEDHAASWLKQIATALFIAFLLPLAGVAIAASAMVAWTMFWVIWRLGTFVFTRFLSEPW